MNDVPFLHVLTRWLHVAAAIAAVGGAVFIRLVLMPAARKLPDEAHQALRAAVRQRWAMVLYACILLLLVSGLFNYMAVAMPMHRGQALYHGLAGVKIILAFVVFFIGSALAGRSAAFEPMRQKAPTWLTLNVLLGLLVVAIACVLKFIPPAGR